MSFAAALEDGMMSCSNRLRVIDLRNCHVGARGVKALFDVMAEKGALSNMEELDLTDNKSIGDEGIAEVLSALERGGGRKLEILHLERMGMTDVGATLLAEALATKKALPPTLTTICVDYAFSIGPTPTDEGRKAIKKGLKVGGWLKRPGFSFQGL